MRRTSQVVNSARGSEDGRGIPLRLLQLGSWQPHLNLSSHQLYNWIPYRYGRLAPMTMPTVVPTSEEFFGTGEMGVPDGVVPL